MLRYAAACVALLVTSIGGAGDRPRAEGPNVVVYIADDHGCDAGCYGNPVIRTPHLDALASEGVVFDRAFCTTASCSSSRAVILTGLHGHTNGQYGLGHAEHAFRGHADVVSLPAWLSAAGYRTARVGKLHVYPKANYQFDRVLKASARDPVAMARACREVIAADADRPFFLYVATIDPHRGAGVGPAPLRANRFGNEEARAEPDAVRYNPEEVVVPAWLPNTPACRAELAEYYVSVSRVDAGLGALIDELKTAGEWNNTLLVYLSDHGIAMQGAKTTLYEPGMRSPLVVRHPASSRVGERADELVSWTDLTPTLLDAAGVLSHGDVVDAKVAQRVSGRRRPFQGRSFLPLITGEGTYEPRDAVFGSHTFHEVTMYYPMRVVREERYKLIWNVAHQLPFPSASDLWDSATWQTQLAQGSDAPYGLKTVDGYLNRPRLELYDLAADPDEANNLAADPAHAATAERLTARLQRFQERTQDPWRLKWRRE
ncbi:MAG: sulfatase [Planctomycetota bacterium]